MVLSERGVFKKELNEEYHINSDNIENYISESGYFVDSNNFFIYPTKIGNLNEVNNLFMKSESEKIRKLCKEYKLLCGEYAQYVDFLIEIKLIRKQITVMVDSEYLYDNYYLYSLNIDIVSKTTKRSYERGFGGRNDFESINNLHEELTQLLKVASLTNQIKKIKTGFYDVVLDQEATGLFVHEFIGHLFEADNNLINSDNIKLKKKVSSDFVTIIDNPTLKNGFGSYLFDDEGTVAQKTYMIKDGKINSLLHSKRTASLHNKLSTSNARVHYSQDVLVRMSNTYMLPNKKFTRDNLINSVEDGVYIRGTNGSYSGSNVILGFREMYQIKNGIIGDLISNMKIVGDTWSILNKIDMVANDLKIFGGGNGGCYKMEQGPLEVSSGGPHIKLKNVMLFPDIKSS